MSDLNLNSVNDVVSGVEPVKKRTGAIVGGIAAGALVVVVGGGIAAYSFSDFVKNQVKLRLSKPENYYSWVTEKNCNEFASEIAGRYREALENQKKGETFDLSVKYEPSSFVKDTLSSELGESEEANNLIDIIKGLDNATVGCYTKTNGNDISAEVFASINDEKLTSVEAAANTEALDVFLRIPELNEQWIVIDSLLDELGSVDDIKVKNPEDLISPDELESLIVRYTDLYTSLISDVKIEKKEEVAISDISMNYTVAEIAINSEKAEEIAVEFLKAFKEDDVLRAIAVDRLGEITNAEFDQAIDDAIEEVQDNVDDDTDYAIIVKTYIDAYGDFRGINATTTDDKDDEIMFVMGKDGSEIRGEAFFRDNGDEEFRLDLALKEDNKTYNGSCVCVADDEEVKVEFIDLTAVGKDDRYLNGQVKITVPDIDTLYLDLASDGKTQQISSDIVVEGDNYGKVTIELASDFGAEVNVPDKSAAFELTEDNMDEFTSTYLDDNKFMEYVKNIMKKIGLSDDLADMVAQSASKSLFYTYDDDDYYYDDDFGGWDADDNFMIDTDDNDIFWEDTDSDSDANSSDNDFSFGAAPAHMIVMDNNFASYSGYESNIFKVENPDIKKDGTYKFSVEVDPKGFKEYENCDGPEGLYILGFEIAGIENAEDVNVTVKSVKIDGKEMNVPDDLVVSTINDSIVAYLFTSSYFDDDDAENAKQYAEITTWSDIVIEIEVKGIK